MRQSKGILRENKPLVLNLSSSVQSKNAQNGERQRFPEPEVAGAANRSKAATASAARPWQAAGKMPKWMTDGISGGLLLFPLSRGIDSHPRS